MSRWFPWRASFYLFIFFFFGCWWQFTAGGNERLGKGSGSLLSIPGGGAGGSLLVWWFVSVDSLRQSWVARQVWFRYCHFVVVEVRVLGQFGVLLLSIREVGAGDSSASLVCLLSIRGDGGAVGWMVDDGVISSMVEFDQTMVDGVVSSVIELNWTDVDGDGNK